MNPLKNKIEELKKQIGDRKGVIELRKALIQPDMEILLVDAKLQAYEEAQKIMDEMLKQTNLRNHSREQNLKKGFDETLKNIIDEIEKREKIWRNERFDIHEIKQIIQKHYSVRVKGRAPNASQSTSNKRDTGNPDNKIPPSQEQCGDAPLRQHRSGTHPEEKQVSKENDTTTASGDSNSKKYTEEECDCKMFVGGSGKLCPECKDNFEQYKDAVIEDRRHIK